MKRYKVTPTSPMLLLAVQVTIYAIYSFVALALIFAVSFLLFDFKFSGSLGMFLAAYLLVMLSMFSIGLMVGGISPDMKIASVVASALYFHMLIFSGATLPYEVMPVTLQKVVDILPLTQGIKLLKATSLGIPVESMWTSGIILISIMIICNVIAIKFFKWE